VLNGMAKARAVAKQIAFGDDNKNAGSNDYSNVNHSFA
jgi:hypothetical protein